MDNALLLFVGLIVIGYIILYLSGRYYLKENFQMNPMSSGPELNNVPPEPTSV